MIGDRWETAIQNSRGKCLAFLLHKGFDIVVAEDSVGAAVAAALTAWAENPPKNPEAWLLTVSMHRALDQVRKSKRLVSLADADEPAVEPAVELEIDVDSVIPDERLRLYFLCTHPALDASLQCPLMLQLVVGMTVEQIADLYLVSAQNLAQRLVRAKRKIRDAGILPSLPDSDAIPNRIAPVLNAIYGLFFREWQGSSEPESALELALILADLLPQHAETLGLAALIALCDSRKFSRTGINGEYVPLDEQEISKWNFAKIELGEAYLSRAAKLGSPGRFQIEAAIQSAHIHRRLNDSPSWKTIVHLYDRLLIHAPTAGFLVGRAAALAKAGEPILALEQLDQLVLPHPDIAETYVPYLVTRAHILADLGKVTEAKEFAERARSRTVAVAEKDYLTSAFGLWREAH